MSGKETYSILEVDDDRSMREFLEILLTKEGYQVSLAASGEEAFKVLENNSFDLTITDIRMQDIDGIDVLKKAKALNPESVVIMISAFATAETAVEAMKEGAYDYIPKPFKVRDFKKIVRDALESRKPSAGVEGESDSKSIQHFGCLVGESPQIKRIYDLVERVGPTKSNVFISGESGTGKELVAKAIHRQSPRSGKNFVVINCAGIPDNLIESELFGYKKGAFTGAAADKEGLFEVADGGTVFLDEVGELTPAIQVKLLRVIQERTFTAVGGTEEKSVDVRLISATNKDLAGLELSMAIERKSREHAGLPVHRVKMSYGTVDETKVSKEQLEAMKAFLQDYELAFVGNQALMASAPARLDALIDRAKAGSTSALDLQACAAFGKGKHAYMDADFVRMMKTMISLRDF